MKSKAIHILLVLICTTLAYIPIFQNEFTNHDDDRLIVNNPVIKTLDADTVLSYFSGYYDNLYQPVTLLSWAVNYQISGDEPWSYQLLNLLLHLLNVLLIYRLVRLLTKEHLTGIIAAAIFGVMTIHVESVAWMSERKDVLYTAFYLMSLVAYVQYIATSKIKHLLFSILGFALALMSKGQAISLVLVLPLIEYVMKEKTFAKRLLIAKVPFVLLAVGSAYITIQGVSASPITYQSASSFAWYEHFAFGTYSYVLLFIKTIIPFELTAFYSYPVEGIRWTHWLSIFPFVAVIIAAIRFRKYKPWLVFGLLFFTVTILVTLKITPWQTGDFMTAERYAYVPSIGVCLLLAIWFTRMLKREGSTLAPKIAVTGLILTLAGSTAMRVMTWQTSETLWTDVLIKNDQNLYGLLQLGKHYEAQGNWQKALESYDQATLKQPLYYPAYKERGNILIEQGHYELARGNFDRAIELQPAIASNYYLRGLSWDHEEKWTNAIADYTKAIELEPEHKTAYNNRGICLGRIGELDKAIADFNKALEIDPDFGEAYRNRGMALKMKKGQN